MLNESEKTTYSFQEIIKSFFLKDQRDLWVIVVFGVFASLGSLVVPVAVQTFVNTLGFGLLLQPILILAMVVFFVLSFSSIVNILQVYVMELLQQRWFSEIAIEFAMRLTRVDSKVFKKNHSSDFVNYFFDIVTIQKTLTVLVLDAVVVCLQIFFGMVLLAFYHPYFLIFDLMIIGFILLVFIGMRGPAIETSLKESKAKFEMGAWLGELARNSALFGADGCRDFALKKADDLAAAYVLYRKKHFRVLLKQLGGAAFLQVVMSSLLLGVGGWLVIERQLTLGQLVAAELVVTSVVAGISKFGKYLESYYDLVAAIGKIGQVIELPLESRSVEVGFELDPRQPLIRVKDLSYQNDFGVNLFSNLNFDVQAGAKIAIVGKNGSGKTTLAEFLYGIRQPSSGKVFVNGVDLRMGHIGEVRSQFAWVGPAQLFDGTILENIRLHRKAITIAQIQDSLHQFGLGAWVDSLPDGLMTQVRAGKYPFSSGQAQKLMLVRAIVAKPSLVILDESLDQLDPDSFDLVSKNMLQRHHPWSVIVTTRHEGWTQYFDRSIFLNEGQVTQRERANG
jgi:ABC-type bacteriocin/lantibiotic exporter with double-glycine peptidase domain